MDKIILGASICVLPFILLVPNKLKLNISFLIAFAVASVSSIWAFDCFMDGEFFIPLFELPVIGKVTIVIDDLSAIFILTINLITFAGSIYAMGYLSDYSDSASLSLHLVSLNILHVSMILVTCFQNFFAFLIVWELMSATSFLLVIFESEKPETVKAGIYYIVQMHIGGFFLMLAFMWFYKNTGELTFERAEEYLSNHNNLPFFLLLFAGFGMKAGMVPLHSWLPKAYSVSPAHFAGIMSGAMTKMGLYGIFRTVSLIHANHEEIGIVLLVISTITALYGIINSLIQKDIKKALAYSSIQNIGVIGLGIGTGVVGIGVNDYRLSFFGFTSSILHLLNHSLFKSLLFLSIGGVYKKTGTNDMELMGGIIKKMPVTGFLFLIGSVAICALPPFNGFISGFLLFNGFIEGMNATNIPVEVVLLVALISVALIGGLAVYSFTRIFGLSFLGIARSKLVQSAQEVNVLMLIPQFLLAILMLAGGIFPQFFFRLSGKVAGIYLNDYNTFKVDMLQSLNSVSITMVVFIAVFGIIYLVRYYVIRKNREAYGSTWACGYTGINNRMQYTPGSFAEYVGTFAGGVVKGNLEYEPIGETEIFPRNRSLTTKPEDPVEEIVVLKPVQYVRDKLNLFAIVQTGRTASYIMYAFVFLLVMFILTFFKFIE